MLIPQFVPADSAEFDQYDESVDGIAYKVFERESNVKVYPGEIDEVVQASATCFVEYHVNNEVFGRLHQNPKVLWRFFTSSAPRVEGERLLRELQEF